MSVSVEKVWGLFDNELLNRVAVYILPVAYVDGAEGTSYNRRLVSKAGL